MKRRQANQQINISPQINCRGFERQVADWVGGRLPLERSEAMLSHQKRCDSCRRAAQAEAQLRRDWQPGAATGQTANLWPRVLMRLEDDRREADHQVSRPTAPRAFQFPRWAMGGALALTVLGVYSLRLLPLETGTTGQGNRAVSTPIVSPAPAGAVVRQGGSLPWMALSDVAQTDPAVDDPVGASMENVWVTLKTNRN